MRLFPTRHRFSLWDGTQDLGVAADDVLGAMVDDLMEYGDLRWAMRNLMSRGMDIPQGGHKQGLREMLRNLRDRKRENLDQFNLSGIFKDIEKQLDEILDMERGSIDELLEKKDDDFSNQVLQQIAENNKEKLDSLPDNAAGKMQQLEKYEFLNPEAQKKYIELLNKLREAMTQTFFKDIERMVNNMSPGDIERMKDMLKSLNDLMSKKSKGVDPDVLQSHFDKFMDQFGDMFGDNPPRNRWTNCIENRCAQQMAAAQSLLNSHESAAQRASSCSLMLSEPLRRPGTRVRSCSKPCVKELDCPRFRIRAARATASTAPERHRPRSGDCDLMNEDAGNIDELIREVQEAERGAGLGPHRPRSCCEHLHGRRCRREPRQPQGSCSMPWKKRATCGATGDNRWELTPRGSRMIGLAGPRRDLRSVC